MAGHAFLTDRRREFLEGDYNLDRAKDRQLKRRIEKNTETALTELIEVATSPEIDNSEVFDPNQLARLIHALMTPPDGLTPAWDFDGDSTEFYNAHQYQFHLYSRLNHTLDGYGDMLHRDHPPGTQPTFSINVDADDLPDQ